MREGEVVLGFLADCCLALQSACCPCYRFGKNMRRGGFGYCFLQGTFYFIFVMSSFLNFLAFIVTKRSSVFGCCFHHIHWIIFVSSLHRQKENSILGNPEHWRLTMSKMVHGMVVVIYA